jgi:hypothetical protein
LKKKWEKVPTMLQFFEMFWPKKNLKRICRETNWYATEEYEVEGENGETHIWSKGGKEWKPLTVKELKPFIACSMYMCLKKLPNVRWYWMKSEPLLYCHVIVGMFSRTRFLAISRCLHLQNPRTISQDRNALEFDKIRHVRWLLNSIRDACKEYWNVGEYVTIDEMMIRYKGVYCPARQYMPKKPEKWGLKIWCLVDSRSKFVWDFDIYTGASLETMENKKSSKVEAGLGQRVVESLTVGLRGKGHVVVMDNFFTSVELFRSLEQMGIYATGMVRTNRVGLPAMMKATKTFKKNAQGTLHWRFHDDRKLCAIMWMDKKPVCLLSTHKWPHAFPCEISEVPRHNGSERLPIRTSLVHLEYTTHMRGVDVADHLRGNYSCQTRSHRWWNRLFYFLLDQSWTNMWIMHKEMMVDLKRPKKEHMMHYDFILKMCKALTSKWGGRKNSISSLFDSLPGIHCPVKTNLRRLCVKCKKQTNCM